MTASTAITQLLYLLDEAFEGTDWHSLIGNLRPVTNEDWLWIPPGGSRSIRDIVQHVGGSKFMYHDHAFGDATLAWDDPLVDGGEALASSMSAIEWLRAGQERLRRSIAALTDDSELLRPRLTNWGEWKETRWIIVVMIQHDLYHAGEINHLRSLRQGTDRWAYDTGEE
jgi:uncharacterized damage-inducible protein DinB